MREAGDAREVGTVKWFSSEKGYGFIERDGREDVFVHHSQISMEGFRTLDAGEVVEFEIVPGQRGPKAQDVRRPTKTAGSDRTPPEPSVAGVPDSMGHDGTTDGSRLTLVEQIRRKLGSRFFT